MEQIITLGDSVELVLNHEMLQQIGVGSGDKVEVKVANGALTVRSLSEPEEERLMDEAMKSLMDRRSKLFERLAEGPK
ncbi:MAG: hypothetical protein ABI977_08870 [Acidobacteriota bacterium]